MTNATLLDLVSALLAVLGSLFGDAIAPLHDYVNEQRGRPFDRHKSVEEQRLERFWRDYYGAQARYYDDLAKLDWVAYYKNHGTQINLGNGRLQFAPMIVVPRLEPMSGTAPQSVETGSARQTLPVSSGPGAEIELPPPPRIPLGQPDVKPSLSRPMWSSPVLPASLEIPKTKADAAPTTQRTQVRFYAPANMKVHWLTTQPDGKPAYSTTPIETPGRYNFAQGSIYRLKLRDIPNHASLELYPTLEVTPTNAKTREFLAHNCVEVTFSAEDFQQVLAKRHFVKVIYLPDDDKAEPQELVSTRLEPGVDPIQEALRRGSILLVIRMGNVDQEILEAPPLNPSFSPMR